MASFADVETEEPAFAARVRAAFDAHGHKFLATLRADGSPRISGIETRFLSGELWLAGMPRSVKFADMRGDPRIALHSGSDEPDTFSADAKVSGRRSRSPRGSGPRSPPPPGSRPSGPGSSSSGSIWRRWCWSLSMTRRAR